MRTTLGNSLTEPLVELVYVSQSSGRLSTKDIVKILHSARTWNEASGVTGLLFYKDGYFGQIIEGNYEAIALACDRIKRDRRHHKIRQLESRPIPQRFISGHPLAFYGDNGLTTRFPALSDALTNEKSDASNLSRLMHLAAIGL